jgi:hypothetical protein
LIVVFTLYIQHVSGVYWGFPEIYYAGNLRHSIIAVAMWLVVASTTNTAFIVTTPQ